MKNYGKAMEDIIRSYAIWWQISKPTNIISHICVLSFTISENINISNCWPLKFRSKSRSTTFEMMSLDGNITIDRFFRLHFGAIPQRFWDINLSFLGEMQRVAFHHVCVCVSVCLCVYATFVDLRKTVWDRDAAFLLNCSEWHRI